jgi:mannose-6-phosphate isomerase-like protein (cupin superfamily)
MIQETQRVSTEPRWFSLNLVRVHVSNTGSEGRFSLIEMSARRYDSPLHVHHHESETHYVLEGILRIHTPGRSVELHPGDAFYTPRGVPQMYQVVSDAARWLLVMAPGGFDELVMNMSEPAARDELPPGPHRGAKVIPPADALRAYGLETLGPPGTMPDPPATTQSR